MGCERNAMWEAPARLVNTRWGFETDWVSLKLALEQFTAHSIELQDGLHLEWCRGATSSYRLDPTQIRALATRLPAEA
jgi:hypothetical protein